LLSNGAAGFHRERARERPRERENLLVGAPRRRAMLKLGAGASNKAVGRLGISHVVDAGLSGLAVLRPSRRCGSPRPQRSAWSPGSWGLPWQWAGSWPRPRTPSWAPCRPPSQASRRPPTRSRDGLPGPRVAVIGSLISSLYSSDVEGSLVTCLRRHRRGLTTSLAPPMPSPPSWPRRRAPGCLRPPARRSPGRWVPAW
jgi:hypothetical protein